MRSILYCCRAHKAFYSLSDELAVTVRGVVSFVAVKDAETQVYIGNNLRHKVSITEYKRGQAELEVEVSSNPFIACYDHVIAEQEKPSHDLQHYALLCALKRYIDVRKERPYESGMLRWGVSGGIYNKNLTKANVEQAEALLGKLYAGEEVDVAAYKEQVTKGGELSQLLEHITTEKAPVAKAAP